MVPNITFLSSLVSFVGIGIRGIVSTLNPRSQVWISIELQYDAHVMAITYALQHEKTKIIEVHTTMIIPFSEGGLGVCVGN